MKSSDYIVKYLYSRGFEVVFEVIGGMTTHLIDSLCQFQKIRVMPMHHEQSAAFAVDAYARIKGKPCFAMATSGPGATNLLTGIGSCYFDSTPGVFITGQVNTYEQRGTRRVRQSGFQETDIVAVAGPLCKGVWQISSGEEIPSVLEKAVHLACSGRPGPVLIDIPMDMQRCSLPDELQLSDSIPKPVCDNQAISGIAQLFADLGRAKRPLILAGGGIRAAQVAVLLRKLVEILQVPVVNSLMCVDALPYGSKFRVGMIGSYGNRWANKALGESDLLIVLGSRLDVRQTGADKDYLTKNRVVWHIDCDPEEIGSQVNGCRPIVGHLAPILAEMLEFAGKADRAAGQWKGWIDEIAGFRKKWPDTAELAGIEGINPNAFIHDLSAASALATVFLADVGQHQMWAAQSIELSDQQRFITSGGMGAMGFALPGAIGAAVANPDKPVVVIAGDGGMQMNIQELQTIRRNNLPVKIVVMNNSSLGMVRQFQESYFSSRFQSTVIGYSAPDFVKVADAYGISGCSISGAGEIETGLKALWRDTAEPYLLEVKIDPRANVYPKIAYGYPLTEMEPFVAPIEMECT